MRTDVATNDEGSEQGLTPERIRWAVGDIICCVEDGVGYCQMAAENLEWIREEISELDALLPERGEGGESRTAIEHNIEGPAATGPRRGDIRSIIGRITGYLDDGLGVAHGVAWHLENIREDVADIEALLPEEP
jgi:hypothetical protein